MSGLKSGLPMILNQDVYLEYKREDLGKGVRGKHYAAFQKGSNLVLLTPELAKIFPTNEAVNAAIASLVGVARSAVTKTRRTSATTAKRSSANTRFIVRQAPISATNKQDDVKRKA